MHSQLFIITLIFPRCLHSKINSILNYKVFTYYLNGWWPKKNDRSPIMKYNVHINIFKTFPIINFKNYIIGPATLLTTLSCHGRIFLIVVVDIMDIGCSKIYINVKYKIQLFNNIID